MDNSKKTESTGNLIRFDDGMDDEAVIEFFESRGLPIPKRKTKQKETKQIQ